MPDTLSPANATTVARLLTDGATARTLLDALSDTLDSETTVTSASEEADGRWSIAVHFQNAPNEIAVRALVALAAGPDAANAVTFERLVETDWVKASLDGLPPVRAGRFVVHGAHDRTRIPANAVGIEIEAALAFGTGHHGTTRGCLVALDALAKRGARPRRMLDVGTGTGVLAIAAARTLNTRVLASDIDWRAVHAARDNIRLNRVGAMVETTCARGLNIPGIAGRAPFDLVCANILLGPLLRLARPIAQVTARRGRVVLSGLLPAHANAALAAYRGVGLRLEKRLLIDSWVTLVLRH
jgi:ribosomal protein L11 methyltransferase